MRRVARWLRPVPPLLALSVGCEMLIDGELATIHCDDEGAIGPPACPSDQVCSGSACVDLEGLGRSCFVDAECGADEFCLDPRSFDGEGPSVCSRGCCTSSDCDQGGTFVCWIPDRGGGGFCLEASRAGRSPGGAGRPGEPCADGGTCRSGLCVDGACADACCSDTSCAPGGQSCQLTHGVVSSGIAWACRPSDASKKPYLSGCADDAECASGACVDIAGIRRCTIPCCGSSLCPGAIEVAPGEVHGLGCIEVGRGDALFHACAAIAPDAASTAVGTPCTNDTQCRSGMCMRGGAGTEGICTDVCCTDASCGDASLFGCRPYAPPAFGGVSWALRCEPK